MVKSACGIEAVYMCFNGTGIWGGETLSVGGVTIFFTRAAVEKCQSLRPSSRVTIYMVSHTELKSC